jgi:hypothetical protein
MFLLKQRKSESLQNAQNDKIENVKEPVHGRYWNMQGTVHIPLHRPKQNSTFNHKSGNILN